jgi:hypothetical protein
MSLVSDIARLVVIELLDALRAAGVDEDKARAAAAAVLGAETHEGLATKADLSAGLGELRLSTKADLAELRAELIKWNVGTIIVMTAVFAVIVKLL